jgi:hypothetical protein
MKTGSQSGASMPQSPDRSASGLRRSSPRLKRVLRPCPICRAPYVQASSLKPGCSAVCRMEVQRQKELKRAAKSARLEKREARERLKTRRDYEREAQRAFNAWVRERDHAQPCISCGRNTGAKRNAGHYLSVGSHPELRFDEANVHSQCEHCNSWQSGNVAAYRLRLIEKIGLAEVERLEGPHAPKKYTVDELKAIRKDYQLRTRLLKERRELRSMCA